MVAQRWEQMIEIHPPPGVEHVLAALRSAGFQGYLVGGCVRDSLMSKVPKDWDIATDALPSAVQRIFPGAKGVGAAFGTVVLPHQGDVEVTTFRRDLGYVDGRHPTAVEFGDDIEEDLKRRDFTINAMAWEYDTHRLIDPTGGVHDLEERLIRTVGDPSTRFAEDALRLLRMVRFACRFEFDVYSATWEAAEGLAHLTARLSRERVRDEFLQILGTENPGMGLWMLQELGILFVILPELAGSERVRQGKRGAPTLLDHLMQAAAVCEGDAILRLAALLHDAGKPATRAISPEGRVTFHGHANESSELAEEALRRLRIDSAGIKRVSSLVRHHMESGEIAEKTVRRWLSRYGEGWVRDLIALRTADYLASGGTSQPKWLEQQEAMLNRLLAEEGVLTPGDLAVNGHDVMGALSIPPGPLVGQVMADLYDFVLEDPRRNTNRQLIKRAEAFYHTLER